MAKILVIDRCTKCNRISWNTYTTSTGSSSEPYCLTEKKTIESEYEIPEWCPLDDAPEE